MKRKILLLDWDGVLYRGKYFSDIYCEEFGADKNKVLEFMDGPKVTTNVDEKDLKVLLKDVLIDWKWKGTAEELLDYWLKSDCEITEDTINFLKESKKLGFEIYVATDQEKYKADYIWNVVGAKKYLDGKFMSCETKLLKNDPRFFEYVIKILKVLPEQILYFDDSRSKIEAAEKTGIDARLFTDFESMKNEVLN